MKKSFYLIPLAAFALFSCAGTPNNSDDGAEALKNAAESRNEEAVTPENAVLQESDAPPVENEADEGKSVEPVGTDMSGAAPAQTEPAAQKMNAQKASASKKPETPPAPTQPPKAAASSPSVETKLLADAEKLNPSEIDMLPELKDGKARAEDVDAIEEPLVRELEVPAPARTKNTERADGNAVVQPENGMQEEAVPPELDDLLAMLESPQNEMSEVEPAQSELEQSEEPSSETESATPEAEPEQAASEPPRPVPSRAMSAKKNQLIDVVYPGRGWIYQGNIDADGNADARQRNFIFGGRKLSAQNQTFTVRARNAGTFLLHFYKNDALTGSYIDDYLEVSVEDDAAPLNSRVTAPDYAQAVPPAAKITAETVKAEKARQRMLQEQAASPESAPAPAVQSEQSGNMAGGARAPETTQVAEPATAESEENSVPVSPAENANVRTSVKDTNAEAENASVSVGQTAEPETDAMTEADAASAMENSENSESGMESPPSVTENAQNADTALEEMTADDLLARAKTQYESKEYEKSFETLKQFFLRAESKIDEGLWLQGAVLEAPSNIRSIKNAIDSYDALVRLYPKSALRDTAAKRSVYLKRFYINIR
ncbi:MAG: hypothetical protein ACTTKL_04415 [Treponema sp.]